jgi:hypothetical protein
MYMPRKKTTSLRTESIKKSHPRKRIIIDEDDEDYAEESKRTREAIENNRQQILEMQNKILAAPAMNGGFSTLMYKIEKIEQSQGQLVEKVDEIRDVLYDPDSGIYARIKNVENSIIDVDRFSTLETEISSIRNWKISEEKSAEKENSQEEKIEKMLAEHDVSLKELQRWYQKQAAITKWLAITISAGLLGGIGKFLYAFILEHVKVI